MLYAEVHRVHRRTGWQEAVARECVWVEWLYFLVGTDRHHSLCCIVGARRSVTRELFLLLETADY